eukprot:8424510-Alexandrium_andersonii.AAC.1
MQSCLFRQVADAPEAVLERYEHEKRQHLDTEATCQAAGVRFTPLVLEAHGGGWSKATRNFADWLAAGVAAARGGQKESESLRIAQRISATLHRENA